MKRVLAVIGKSVEEQTPVFDELDLNPYDNYEDADPEFNTVIYEDGFKDWLSEIEGYYTSYETGLSEQRASELISGQALNDQDIQIIRERYIEDQLRDEAAVYAVFAELSDGSNSIFALYYEQCQGGLGINIIDFDGFYQNEKIARDFFDNKKGLIDYT